MHFRNSSLGRWRVDVTLVVEGLEGDEVLNSGSLHQRFGRTSNQPTSSDMRERVVGAHECALEACWLYPVSSLSWPSWEGAQPSIQAAAVGRGRVDCPTAGAPIADIAAEDLRPDLDVDLLLAE
jgi:hypothetical protein